MNRFILVACILLFLSATGWAVEKPVIESEDDRINYSVGHQVGRDLVRQGVDVNPEVLLQGIIDASSGNEPMMPFKQMVDTLVALKGKIVKTYEQMDEGLRILGRAFLEDNAKKEGVITLESGLQYKILQAGKGKNRFLVIWSKSIMLAKISKEKLSIRPMSIARENRCNSSWKMSFKDGWKVYS